MLIKYESLIPGEVYKTTKDWDYSNYDNLKELISVPKDTTLLYRSTWPSKKGNNIIVLFWLEKRLSVCLSANKKRPMLYLKHVPWRERKNNNEEA